MDDKLAIRLILAYRDQADAFKQLCHDLLPTEEADSPNPRHQPTFWQRFNTLSRQDAFEEIYEEKEAP